MKKLTIALAAVLTLGVTAGFGMEPPYSVSEKNPISLQYDDQGKLNLKVLAADKGRMRLQVYQASGKKLFEDQINYKGAFQLPIDMSELGPGEYKVVLDGSDISHEQEVFQSALTFEDVHASMQDLENDRYAIKVLHEGVPVKVEIQTKEGKTIYNKTYLRKSNFEQVFDLSAYKGQDLTATISGEKSYIRFDL